MGGPGSGPKRAPISVRAARIGATLTLASLYPDALKDVKRIVRGRHPDPATVRWVIEMNDGKAHQRVIVAGDQQAPLQVVGLIRWLYGAAKPAVGPDSGEHTEVESDTQRNAKQVPDSGGSP